MSELLSPVGSKDSFYAAIANGCDAVYLGLNKHNARAYADNFSLENIKEYIDYAHLRNVKVYVTLNTIVYDSELNEIYSMIDELAKLGADAIIVQDLAVLYYAVNKYSSLEVHASTQMGIDDLYGAKFLESLGVKRVVLARETPIDTIKEIKNKSKIELETFIHGALCVSYSGNCFMSSTIGERSGNRGRCAGCCRKEYSLIDLDENKIINKGYLLSLKDLNLSSYIKKMDFIDSFKIEGRMKEPTYVAAVTNIYRQILDNQKVDITSLDKVFNRTYTKGFIFSEDSKDISNILRPNNFGYPIGKISKIYNNKIWIKLFKKLSKGDHIRIHDEYSNNDINVNITKMFDANFHVINSSDKLAIIYLDKKVKINSIIYKTLDNEFNSSLNLASKIKEYKKIPINFSISIKLNEEILLKCSYKNHAVYQKSDYIVGKMDKLKTKKEDVIKQLSKLNDTPYMLGNIEIDLDDNVFVPLSVLNELRRNIIEKLTKSRLNKKVILNKNKFNLNPKKFVSHEPILSVEVSNISQYEAAKEMGIKHIYFKNKINRNNSKYIKEIDEILVGGYGAISYYKNEDVKLVSDVSFNVNNHVSVALLSTLGIERITLSNEINQNQINTLINQYIDTYNTHPNLELIIYGRTSIMHSKYCPLKNANRCGECKKKDFALKDNFETFPIRFNDDCTINLLNSKTLNLLDEINKINGINYFRLVFTTESSEEVKNIINLAKDKLNGNNVKTFNGEKETRGNFKKQLL